MINADLRNFTNIDPTADCVDKAEPAKPVRKFEEGQSNELMILRACAIYDPVMSGALLGSKLIAQSGGQPAMVSMSAFVQEPT